MLIADEQGIEPGAVSRRGSLDFLTQILRNGARALLGQAIEAEVAEFLAKHADLKTATGQQCTLGQPENPSYYHPFGSAEISIYRDNSAMVSWLRLPTSFPLSLRAKRGKAPFLRHNSG